MDTPKRPAWVKDKKLHKDFEIIDCKPYDDYKDHDNDFGCYTLIKVDLFPLYKTHFIFYENLL